MATTMIDTAAPRDCAATLFYAGAISGRPRFDVVDPGRNNIAFVPAEVTIRDARPIRDTLTLGGAGFTFAHHHSAMATLPALFEQNLAHHPVPCGLSRQYQDEVAEYLRALTGAREVFPQMGGLLARTSGRARVKSWATPANFVHLDYTEHSARRFLEWTLQAEGRSMPSFGSFAVFQTWRALSPGPQDNTLAVCDGSSVPPEDGVVLDSVIGPEDAPGMFFESRLCKPSVRHQWFYLSDMTPDDLIIFKGFDSTMPHAMNAMHTAFDNCIADGSALPRRSIEARFFALFD